MKSRLLGGALSKEQIFTRMEIPRLENQCASLVKSLNAGLDKIRTYKKDGITVQHAGRAETYDHEEACKLAPEHMAELDHLESVLEKSLVELGVMEPAQKETAQSPPVKTDEPVKELPNLPKAGNKQAKGANQGKGK